MPENQQRIEVLFQKWCNRSISKEEELELLSLVEEKGAEAALSPAFLSIWERLQGDHLLQSSRTEERIADILNNYPGEKEEVIPPAHRIPFLQRSGWKYAAAIIILFGTGAYLWNKNSTTDKRTVSAEARSAKAVKADIAPGGQRAVLTLSDGSTIILDSATNGMLALQGNSEIIKKDGQIIYGNKEGDPSYPPLAGVSRSDGGGPSYNTMATPRGGQYQLTLPDGTKVWLNAASSITYPVAFTGKKRNVKITGEAYFEIAKNKQQPFTVNVNGESSIEVLGTTFNVNSYADERSIKTTLIEGSVKVNQAQKSVILKPGQQALVSQTSQSSFTIPVQTADISQDIAWKNGFFSFKKADLRTVMRQLERWYNVEISYKGNIPERVFSGEIGRSLTLSQVLDVLSQTRINYKIEGSNKITIMP